MLLQTKRCDFCLARIENTYPAFHDFSTVIGPCGEHQEMCSHCVESTKRGR